MPRGALIDPNGHRPESLSESEHEKLAQLLAVLRAGQALEPAMSWLLHLSVEDPEMSESRVLGNSIYHYLSDRRDMSTEDQDDGILAGVSPKDRFDTLSKRELETLRETLTVLHIGSWFAGWLENVVASIANASLPADRCPSPAQVMGTLTDSLSEFEEQIAAARTTVQLRPDLFQDAIKPAAPATQDAPAEPEPTPSIPEAQKVPQGARKRRGVRPAASTRPSRNNRPR